MQYITLTTTALKSKFKKLDLPITYFDARNYINFTDEMSYKKNFYYHLKQNIIKAKINKLFIDMSKIEESDLNLNSNAQSLIQLQISRKNQEIDNSNLTEEEKKLLKLDYSIFMSSTVLPYLKNEAKYKILPLMFNESIDSKKIIGFFEKEGFEARISRNDREEQIEFYEITGFLDIHKHISILKNLIQNYQADISVNDILSYISQDIIDNDAIVNQRNAMEIEFLSENFIKNFSTIDEKRKKEVIFYNLENYSSRLQDTFIKKEIFNFLQENLKEILQSNTLTSSARQAMAANVGSITQSCDFIRDLIEKNDLELIEKLFLKNFYQSNQANNIIFNYLLEHIEKVKTDTIDKIKKEGVLNFNTYNQNQDKDKQKQLNLKFFSLLNKEEQFQYFCKNKHPKMYLVDLLGEDYLKKLKGNIELKTLFQNEKSFHNFFIDNDILLSDYFLPDQISLLYTNYSKMSFDNNLSNILLDINNLILISPEEQINFLKGVNFSYRHFDEKFLFNLGDIEVLKNYYTRNYSYVRLKDFSDFNQKILYLKTTPVEHSKEAYDFYQSLDLETQKDILKHNLFFLNDYKNLDKFSEKDIGEVLKDSVNDLLNGNTKMSFSNICEKFLFKKNIFKEFIHNNSEKNIADVLERMKTYNCLNDYLFEYIDFYKALIKATSYNKRFPLKEILNQNPQYNKLFSLHSINNEQLIPLLEKTVLSLSMKDNLSSKTTPMKKNINKI